MPRVYVIGGPNGAGKTTAATALFPDALRCPEFVNADAIAAGISPFRPESVAMEAGRIMLSRIRRLASDQQDFAFETTMASRSFAPFLRACREQGYTVHLLFVWLRTPDLAIERVARRVAAGGHHIPDDVVRRRYVRGMRNFLNLYAPLARTWDCVDNSGEMPVPVASRDKNGTISVYDAETWRRIREATK
ncbi:MAG: zeta toxin family protein [Candidatus Hydrogenedentes bacterium]|nr:zeta toxin family protein [Candidatus Hydrogenedentota bacterium]